MTEREEFPGIGPEQRMELWLASLAGVPELALEMRRLGLSDPDNPEEALEEARLFLPMLHQAVEEARHGEA